MESAAPTSATPSNPHLSRSLGLWDLVIIGIIMVQPTAPMPGFGAFYAESHGHVIITILIAMVAMLFTAVSYGLMARVYPSAGSAYSYVAQEIHPFLGFATGWSMVLDYVLNPVICVIWCSRASIDLFHAVPYALWVFFYAGLFAWTNLRRIRATARINTILTGVMGVVILAMLVCTARYVAGMPTLNLGFFTLPIYDPQRFSWASLRSGTALAVLTYLGFDGVSTLSEEVKDPRRQVMRAMVLICLITGVLAAIEVYAAQLVWPAGKPFATVETGYIESARIAGGPLLGTVLSVTLLVATFGSGAGALLAGARLLYGMGRSEAIPKKFFAAVNPHSYVPSNNVILIGLLAAAGAFLLSFEEGAALLNFGALFGFMGVNLSAFAHYYWRSPQRKIAKAVMPVLGFLICAAIWWNLTNRAKVIGFSWLAFGLTYATWRTRGFSKPIVFEATDESS